MTKKKRPADIIAAIKQLGIMLGWEKTNQKQTYLSQETSRQL
jgi:hypothetical protein